MVLDLKLDGTAPFLPW
jgi:hypothetical protein